VVFDICALLGLYAALIGIVYRRLGKTFPSLFKGQAVQEEATLLLFLMFFVVLNTSCFIKI